MTIRIPLRLAAAGVILTALTLAAGCSSANATGTVKGTVTYNGDPVKSGTVNFLSAAGVGAQATIDESGNFTFDNPIETGEYNVFVNPPVPTPQQPGTKPKPLPKFAVPQKFREPTSSGVTVKVQAGGNTIPVVLKDKP